MTNPKNKGPNIKDALNKVIARSFQSIATSRGWDIHDRVSCVLGLVCLDYEDKDLASWESHSLHDLHAFYRPKANPKVTVHVQAYPGMSNDKEMRVWARLMDTQRLQEQRRLKIVSIGNEHEATIRQFPNFQIGVYIPYDYKLLESMIAENVPELQIPEEKR